MAATGAPSLAQTYAQGPLNVGSHSPIPEEELAKAKRELEELKKLPGIRQPVRSFMNDQEYAWRFGGPPDYTLADLLYLKGKTMNHAEGSLEQIVEDLVKTWEFERSHKVNHQEHKSLDPERFQFQANGAKLFESAEAHEVGNYNVLLNCLEPKLWAPGQSWEDSHQAFRDAFAAFPWEVLKVFSGPPAVGFSWRHWAHFTGSYKGHQGKGELVEMLGFAVATVSAELRILKVEVYYKPDEFLEVLEGRRPAAQLRDSALGPLCPFLQRAAPGSAAAAAAATACPVSGASSGAAENRGCQRGCSLQ